MPEEIRKILEELGIGVEVEARKTSDAPVPEWLKPQREPVEEKLGETLEIGVPDFDMQAGEVVSQLKSMSGMDEVDLIISFLDDWRKKYHMKFKDTDTFWEMFFNQMGDAVRALK